MEQENIDNKEYKKLYGKARQRVSFKIHITIAILVLAFFWVLWGFIFKDIPRFLTFTIVLSIIWILVIIAHYLIAYRWNKSLVDKELRRMIKEKEKEMETGESKQEEANNNSIGETKN